jgi:GT2 family glycosyltransferase
VSVAVVIPHRRRDDLLARAVASVEGCVTLVEDDTAGEGRGFAATANAGLARAQKAGHDRVLLLNDDAWLLPGALEALLAVDAELVGPVLLDPSGRVESAGLFFSTRTGRLRQMTTVPTGPTEVPALSGACLLMPSTSRFDLAFRHGMEDIELCLRSRGRVVLQPLARCVHVGGATVGRRTRQATREALRGHLRLLRGRPLQQGLAVGYALGQVIRERGPASRVMGIAEALR